MDKVSPQPFAAYQIGKAAYDPTEDGGRLYKAMKRFGTDEPTLIEILCTRPRWQREKIATFYKTAYGRELIEHVESETSGNLRKVLRGLLLKPAEFEAREIRKAVEGLGTNESTLIDIICSKNSQEMPELKETYKRLFNKEMEDDVKDDVSGCFKRFLVSLMSGNRSTSPTCSQEKAIQQARELYEAGEGRWGTNEAVFNRIFAMESYAQLRLVFEQYEKISGHTIEHAIKSEMSSNLQKAFLTLVQVTKNQVEYYAQRLYESMKGLGTNDRLLIRIMVLRSQIDMEKIKEEFLVKYGKSLAHFIRSDTSGDYRRALLCLAGDGDWRK